MLEEISLLKTIVKEARKSEMQFKAEIQKLKKSLLASEKSRKGMVERVGELEREKRLLEKEKDKLVIEEVE